MDAEKVLFREFPTNGLLPCKEVRILTGKMCEVHRQNHLRDGFKAVSRARGRAVPRLPAGEEQASLGRPPAAVTRRAPGREPPARSKRAAAPPPAAHLLPAPGPPRGLLRRWGPSSALRRHRPGRRGAGLAPRRPERTGPSSPAFASAMFTAWTRGGRGRPPRSGLRALGLVAGSRGGRPGGCEGSPHADLRPVLRIPVGPG